MIYNHEYVLMSMAECSNCHTKHIHQYFLAKEAEEKLEIRKKISKTYIFISTQYNKPWSNTAGSRKLGLGSIKLSKIAIQNSSNIFTLRYPKQNKDVQ